ncbi:SgcJ/EcaC family oxidoreductase [Kitasatospora sp. NPDC004531]
MTNDTAVRAADLDAIHAIVATVERTQREKDVEGFLSLLRPDSLTTTGHGKVLIGFDAIAEFTRRVMPSAVLAGEVSYEVAHVQFLRPDVAAVKVRQTHRTADGVSEGTPLYIVSKDEQGWRLHVSQNTEVLAA